MKPDRIEIQLTVRLLTGIASSPVTARLCYSTTDPFAITLLFGGEGARSIEWMFGRELLAQGLRGPTGTGDVRMWPADAGDRVFLELCSPSGHAVFAAERDQVERFLTHTEELVPRGGEAALIDFDSHLAALLGDEPGLTPPELR